MVTSLTRRCTQLLSKKFGRLPHKAAGKKCRSNAVPSTRASIVTTVAEEWLAEAATNGGDVASANQVKCVA